MNVNTRRNIKGKHAKTAHIDGQKLKRDLLNLNEQRLNIPTKICVAGGRGARESANNRLIIGPDIFCFTNRVNLNGKTLIKQLMRLIKRA